MYVCNVLKNHWKMKNIHKLIAVGFIACLAVIIISCNKEDVNRPTQIYRVKYVVSSYMAAPSNFYITYMNPKYSNHVSEYFDTIREWSYEFYGTTFDRLFLEAFTIHDSSYFSVAIYVNDSLKVAMTDTCPTPIICDTNRIAIEYSLQ